MSRRCCLCVKRATPPLTDSPCCLRPCSCMVSLQLREVTECGLVHVRSCGGPAMCALVRLNNCQALWPPYSAQGRTCSTAKNIQNSLIGARPPAPLLQARRRTGQPRLEESCRCQQCCRTTHAQRASPGAAAWTEVSGVLSA